MSPITFSGEINKEIEEEFRDLYYERPPLYSIVYSISGILTLLESVILLATMGEDDYFIVTGLILIVVAILLFVVAFRLQHIWWHWWWPRFLNLFWQGICISDSSKHDR